MIKVDPIRILPNLSSTDKDWISWHEALNKEFGKKQANTVFLRAWNKRTDKGNAFFSGKANTEELRDYMKKQGVVMEKSFADYPVSYFDFVTDFFNSAFNLGKIGGIVAVVLVIIIVLALVRTVVKNPQILEKAAGGLRP